MVYAVAANNEMLPFADSYFDAYISNFTIGNGRN